MARQHKNAQDRMTPFLSNIVPGSVTVETPDTVMMGMEEEAPPWMDTGAGIPYGARSGMPKKLSVK